MKNKKLIIGLAILVVLIIGTLITCFIIQNNTDSYKFKKEYEKYNNESWEYDGKKGQYLNIDISKDNPVIYLNDDNIIKEVTTGDKIIYFGFPECNWCRSALPVLLKAAKENGVEQIYYYNFSSLRAAYEDGKDKEKEEIYQKLTNHLGDFLTKTYEDGNRKGEKRLSAPTVILIKDGKVTSYHYKTVESHKNYNKNLTKTETDELYKIYEEMMIDLIMCTSNC